MIKVSHESPIALLEKSLEYNDYQYCLVHLMEEQPEYCEWFLEKYKAMRPEGEILLTILFLSLVIRLTPKSTLTGSGKSILTTILYLMYLKMQKVQWNPGRSLLAIT